MKLNSKFWKGLAMAIISVIVAAFNTTPVIWSVVAVTVIGTILVYFGKNAWYSSISPSKKVDKKDFYSAILIAAGMAIVSGVASIAGTGIIDWILLAKTVGAAVISYISVTYFEGKPITIK